MDGGDRPRVAGAARWTRRARSALAHTAHSACPRVNAPSKSLNNKQEGETSPRRGRAIGAFDFVEPMDAIVSLERRSGRTIEVCTGVGAEHRERNKSKASDRQAAARPPRALVLLLARSSNTTKLGSPRRGTRESCLVEAHGHLENAGHRVAVDLVAVSLRRPLPVPVGRQCEGHPGRARVRTARQALLVMFDLFARDCSVPAHELRVTSRSSRPFCPRGQSFAAPLAELDGAAATNLEHALVAHVRSAVFARTGRNALLPFVTRNWFSVDLEAVDGLTDLLASPWSTARARQHLRHPLI